MSGLRLAALVAAALLIWRVFAAANGSHVVHLVTSIGLAGVLAILAPQFVALSLEALGWQLAFRLTGSAPRWRSLLRIRLATEALSQSLPLGVAFAESTKPLLLRKHCGLAVDRSVASMTARKVLLLAAQCLYIGGLGALGFAGLEAASHSVIGAPHLGYLTLAAAFALGCGALLSASLLRRSALAQSVLALLERVPLASLNAWLSARRRWFTSTDGAVSETFGADPRRFAVSLLCFTLAWFVESVETWLILQVLGVSTSFVTAGSLEVILSLVRNVVFVVPAGLGVQDVGYATCFAAFGVPEAESVGAAFVLLKRGKELFWIAVGYALLGSDLTLLSKPGAAPAHEDGRLRPAPANA
jgi:uncharacterized membrane protein YbhN (UPF0104 family)